MLFEYVKRSYYIQAEMSILLMRGTYLFDLYGDHIHCYIANMWTFYFRHCWLQQSECKDRYGLFS